MKKGTLSESAYFVGQGTEKPDVSDGNGQLNMPHTLAADFFLGHLDTAAVADNALVAYTFVLATMALPVARWAKNAFAEQPVAFGLECAIVYGFGLRHLSV